MSGPVLPSWSYSDPSDVEGGVPTLTLWGRGHPAPEPVTITGPLATVLVDVLSWVADQTLSIIDPEPEAEPLSPSECTVREWALTLTQLADEMREAVE